MDEFRIDYGTLEERTRKTEEYSVVEKPKIKVVVEKEVGYLLTKLHRDRIEFEADGRYIKLKESLTTQYPTLFERMKISLLLLFHVFDTKYWQEHVQKTEYITQEEESEIRELVERYNSLVDKCEKIDGQVVIKSEETRKIEATPENLEALIKQLEEYSQKTE